MATPGQAATAPGFDALLANHEAGALAADPAVILGIWTDLTIGYFNRSYLSFAAANGAPGIVLRFGLGASFSAALPGPLKDYYLGHLRQALESGEAWEHDYTCDSPTVERTFRLMALPLGKEGLLLVHSLRKAQERSGAGRQLVDGDYREPSGKLTQCCQCRRLRRVDNPLQWDFVPRALDADLQAGISHGLCHPCLAFYYSN